MRHPLCRPPAGHKKVLRLGLNMQWRPDGGTPGLAFIAVDKKDNITVYVAECKCKVYGKCIASRALSAAAENWGGASLERVPRSKR